jgi:hypothetical protein
MCSSSEISQIITDLYVDIEKFREACESGVGDHWWVHQFRDVGISLARMEDAVAYIVQQCNDQLLCLDARLHNMRIKHVQVEPSLKRKRSS